MVKRVQARKKGITGYKSVMRPTRWGNPYSVVVHGRKKSIKLYENWIVNSMSFEELQEWLKPLMDVEAIGCTCPIDLPCHADVLINYIDFVNMTLFIEIPLDPAEVM